MANTLSRRVDNLLLIVGDVTKAGTAIKHQQPNVKSVVLGSTTINIVKSNAKNAVLAGTTNLSAKGLKAFVKNAAKVLSTIKFRDTIAQNAVLASSTIKQVRRQRLVAKNVVLASTTIKQVKPVAKVIAWLPKFKPMAALAHLSLGRILIQINLHV